MTKKIELLTGNEAIVGLDAAVMDFWSWAHSDILGNTERGVFAEFIVAQCLGLTAQPRREWDKVDLRYGDIAIEIKSTAYVQSWKQQKPSISRFDIRETKGWDATTDTTGEEIKRHADIYVFCLLAEKDKVKCNVLDLSQWEFYVVPTRDLYNHYGSQESVSLGKIREIADPVSAERLKQVIDEIIKRLF